MLRLSYFERRNHMQRNRSAFIKAGVREGFCNGASKYLTRRCYGYDVTVDGSLVINPDEAKIVRWMFQRYLHGDSLGKIASGLEKQGILSPTGKSKWNREAIDKLLSNEKYIVVFCFKRQSALVDVKFRIQGFRNSKKVCRNAHLVCTAHTACW